MVLSDAELNAAVALTLGWTVAGVSETEVIVPDVDSAMLVVKRGWARSLDACLLDLAPEAFARNWRYKLWHVRDGTHGCFMSLVDPEIEWATKEVFAGDVAPSRAFARAWLLTKS